MLPNDLDVAAAIEPKLTPSRNANGWSRERQVAFLRSLAEGLSIKAAARAQGMSESAAYAFRHSANGAAFAVGWNAAHLLARQRLADTVAARALDGQTVTVTLPDGAVHERHFYDNRHAMSVLARLDRLAAGQAATGTGAGPTTDATGEGQAARRAASEFDRFLDVLADADDSGGPARAGLFLAARADGAAPDLAALTSLARADLYTRTGAGVACELDTTDLDPARRAGWNAEQWLRAEATGLVALAPAPVAEAEVAPHSPHSPVAQVGDDRVWWCDTAYDWRTNFPPPDDFDGDEEGDYGDDDYERALTDDEAATLARRDALDEAEDAAERDRWFAAAARDLDEETDTPAVEADTVDRPEDGSPMPAIMPAEADPTDRPDGDGSLVMAIVPARADTPDRPVQEARKDIPPAEATPVAPPPAAEARPAAPDQHPAHDFPTWAQLQAALAGQIDPRTAEAMGLVVT